MTINPLDKSLADALAEDAEAMDPDAEDAETAAREHDEKKQYESEVFPI